MSPTKSLSCCLYKVGDELANPFCDKVVVLIMFLYSLNVFSNILFSECFFKQHKHVKTRECGNVNAMM